MSKIKSKKVSIVMGSQSDFKTMILCQKVLKTHQKVLKTCQKILKTNTSESI